MVDVKGYEGLYSVEEDGKVFGHKRKKYLKPRMNNAGYMKVTLCKEGKLKDAYVHRLVAMAYICNPDELPEVNHKDENKTNNTVYNLEWCTRKYNCNYGNRNKRISNKNTK